MYTVTQIDRTLRARYSSGPMPTPFSMVTTQIQDYLPLSLLQNLEIRDPANGKHQRLKFPCCCPFKLFYTYPARAPAVPCHCQSRQDMCIL